MPDEHPQQQRDGTGYERTQHTLRLPPPASGTYYAEVTGSVSGLLASGSYQLELHRLALAQGTQSAATLAETGSMYAFLNGNTLDITGPTGYGFGITGNWTETTATNLFTGQVAATYTATGSSSCNPPPDRSRSTLPPDRSPWCRPRRR